MGLKISELIFLELSEKYDRMRKATAKGDLEIKSRCEIRVPWNFLQMTLFESSMTIH